MSHSLIARLASLMHRRPPANRREAKRLEPGQRTVCLVQGPQETEPAGALVQNLSLKGMGALCEREYPVGSVVTVLLVNSSNTFAVSNELKVVRAFRASHGKWFVGGPFARPLRHDEFVPFMV